MTTDLSVASSTAQEADEELELLDTSLIQRRRIPVVLQSEAMECALACLCMAMAAHGRDIDLITLRRKHPASLAGMSVARLADIALAEGFLLTGYQASANQMESLKLPGVLHWKGNHFVVLVDYRVGRGVTLHDPAVGVRKLGWREFVDGFSGVCAELEPLAQMKREVRRERLSLFTLLKRTPDYAATLAKMGVIALLLEALMLVSPLLLQTVVDEVIPAGDERLLWSLVAGFGGVALLRAGMKLTHGWLGMALTGALALGMKVATFRHMLALPLNWFEKRGIGTVTARYRSLDAIRSVLADNVLTALVDGVVTALMVVVLLVYEWRLALLTLGLAAVSFFATLLMYRRYARAAAESILADAEENRILVESVSAVPAVKMFGQELRQLRLYRRAVTASTNRMLDMLRVNNWNEVTQLLLACAGDICVVAVAAHYVLAGPLTLGVLFGFYAYKQVLSDKLNALGRTYFQFRVLSVYTSNVADVLLGETEPQEARALKVGPRPALEFRNVSFAYDEAVSPTLRDFDLLVRPGEVVGVTGPSGCGKSTLVKLLTGSLLPSRGSISLDGEELVGLAPKQIRAHLSVVLQSDHLMTGTLLDNVTLFEAEPDLARVGQALADAALLEFVEQLPNGLDTHFLGHGPTLSGGQRQRLLLARAFYKGAPVLVLDEATSALDVPLEIHVCDAIRRKGLTTLMVAHRQETLSRCDRVVHLAPTREDACCRP